MNTLDDYLGQIYEILDKSKPSVLPPGKPIVDKEAIYEILKDISLHVPAEIRKAKKIIDTHDSILEKAHEKAAEITQNAEAEAQLLINDNEIYKNANEQATDRIEEAKKKSVEYHVNAIDYVDGVLEETEKMIQETRENIAEQFKLVNEFLKQTGDVLYENRQSLRER